MKKRKLADINFERRSPIPKLLIFIWLYVLTLGSFLFTKVMRMGGASSDEVTWGLLLNILFIISAYLLGAALLLFYAVFNAHRFTFADDGIRVLTWRGIRFFRWKEFDEAFLTDMRRNVDLILRCGKRRYLIIPLNSFVRSETLLREIR